MWHKIGGEMILFSFSSLVMQQEICALKRDKILGMFSEQKVYYKFKMSLLLTKGFCLQIDIWSIFYFIYF